MDIDTPGLDKFGRFHNRRELDALRPLLEPGETPLHLLEAWSGPKKGILAATDRRVLFVVSGFMRDQAQSWPYEQLEQVRVGVDVDEAVVFLRTAEREVVFAKCPRRAAQDFAKAVQERPRPGVYRPVVAVTDAKDADPAPDDEPPLTDAEQRLERLERMFKRGSMSEPEYRVARRRILEHNEVPVRKPRPEGAPKPGEPVPLGAPGAGDAPPGTEVLRAADLPEGTDPLGGYKWSKGGGMTTKPPVQSSEDPAKVLQGPAAGKESAAHTVEFEAVPEDFKPVPTSRKPPVDEAPPKPAFTPIRSATKGPIEVEGDPLKEALAKGKAEAEKATGGKGKDDDGPPKRPRVWPPLPGKE